jgi:hypothetical protein
MLELGHFHRRTLNGDAHITSGVRAVQHHQRRRIVCLAPTRVDSEALGLGRHLDQRRPEVFGIERERVIRRPEATSFGDEPQGSPLADAPEGMGPEPFFEPHAEGVRQPEPGRERAGGSLQGANCGFAIPRDVGLGDG